MLALVEGAGLNHGYLENQMFSTAVLRGKDIIWRRAVPATGQASISRAPPRSIPARTSHGSGRASSRVAASSSI